MKYYLAADPGKNGAFVVIDEKNNVLTKVMPLIGKEIDIHQVVQFLSSFEGEKHFVLEDVHAHQLSGRTACFEFGRSTAIIETAVIALGIPYTKVQSKDWQKEMWQGIKPVGINTGKKTKQGNIKYKIDTKASSLLAARRLYPNVSLRDESKKLKVNSKGEHDGIIDALLMAGYCKRKF